MDKAKNKSHFTLFMIISVLIGQLSAFFGLKYALENHNTFEFIYSRLLAKEWSFEANLKAATTGAAMVGLVTVLNFNLTFIFRLFTLSPNPLLKTDSELVSLANTILRNTTEQSFAFLPIYLAWALNVCTETNSHELFIFPIVWCLARVVFTFGYIFQYFTGIITFRSIGFLTNVTVTLQLVLKLTGRDLFTLVKF